MVNTNQELINVTWWLVIATFLAAVVALIIAVFGDWLKAVIFKPSFEIECNLSPPNCERTKRNINYKERVDIYVFRILIKNVGSVKAESIEVLAKDLYKKHPDGAFRKIKSFIPMNLIWTHSNRSTYFPSIAMNMSRHCDLGYIIKPSGRASFLNEDDISFDKRKTIFGFELEVKPNSLQHLVGPGIYRLEVLIAASNTKPTSKIIELNHIGDWYDDENKMFNKGIGIHIV